MRAAFATVRYARPGGASLLCSGVTVGDDGTILTCWHVVDAICASLADATVTGAYSYAIPPGDAYQRYQALSAAQTRALAIDIEYGGMRSQGAALIGWRPDQNVALVRNPQATPRLLRTGSTPDHAAVGLLGLRAGLPPECSIGHRTGSQAAIPISDDDSCGPFFSRAGRMVAILSFVSVEQDAALVSLVSAEQLDSLRSQQIRTPAPG